MFISFLVEFAEAEPLQVQRQNAMLGVGDAALLLELIGVSRGTIMTGQVQNRRRFAVEVVGLVKKSGRLESRNDLVAKLTDTIAVAGLDDPRFFKLGRRLDPFLGPTVVNHVVEEMMAQTSRGGGPLL